MTDYRERIYRKYAKSRHESLAPASIDGLAPRAPYLKKLIRDHFPVEKAAPIIDLGCGHGALLYFARAAGFTNITGVDRSPEQVTEAMRLGILGVQEGDVMSSLRNLPGSSMDAIVAFDVLEHFAKNEVLDFVDEVLRALRSRGRFIIHTVNAESPFFGDSRYNDFTHEIAFSRVSMGQILLSSGFSQVQSFEDAPIVHGAKSAARWVVWKGVRAILRLWTAAETGDLGSRSLFTRNFLTVAIKP